MPPKFLLDENVEGAIWAAIQQHNQSSPAKIAAVRIGDPPDLPLGSGDPAVLLWAERNGYVVVSHDIGTLKDHLADHLMANQHCPGIFLFGRRMEIQYLLQLLAVAGQADDGREWQDLIEYLG